MLLACTRDGVLSRRQKASWLTAAVFQFSHALAMIVLVSVRPRLRICTANRFTRVY